MWQCAAGITWLDVSGSVWTVATQGTLAIKRKVGAQKKVPGGMFLSPGRSCQIRDGLGGRAGVGTAGPDQTLTIALVSFVEGLMIDID